MTKGAKAFNTNFVQSLPLYQVIISNVHVCSFTRTIPHVHGRAPKRFYLHEISCTKNSNL